MYKSYRINYPKSNKNVYLNITHKQPIYIIINIL